MFQKFSWTFRIRLILKAELHRTQVDENGDEVYEENDEGHKEFVIVQELLSKKGFVLFNPLRKYKIIIVSENYHPPRTRRSNCL